MSTGAWNKITQTNELFKKIIAPLKEHLSINFGYMIVFNDSRYYQIIEVLLRANLDLPLILLISKEEL